MLNPWYKRLILRHFP